MWISTPGTLSNVTVMVAVLLNKMTFDFMLCLTEVGEVPNAIMPVNI